MIHTIPEGVHAILSASKSGQWINCMGSLAATRGMSGKPSRYAAEGTVYHSVAERALREDKDCAAYIGDRYQVGEFEFTVDAENAEYAQVYVDAVRAIPGKRFIEVDLDYSALLGVPKTHAPVGYLGEGVETPVAAGTGDCVILDYENRIIHVIDLKFGRGDVVYAKENSQLRLYGIAAVHRYEMLGIEDDWRVSMAIHQPRIHHYDQEVITVGELRAWTEAQRPAAQGAFSLWQQGPDAKGLAATLTPGEKQCRWCPLAGKCVAQRDKILNLFPKGHAEKAVPTLVQLPDEELAEAMLLADELENYVSAVRAEGLTRALQGHTLPHWKLVEGRRGNRQLDEEAQVKLSVEALLEIGIEEPEGESALPVADAIHFAMGEGAYQPRKLLTVAKLQKPLEKKAPLLWAALQEHVKQNDGTPTLKRLEDPRAPLSIVSTEFPLAPTSGAAGLL